MSFRKFTKIRNNNSSFFRDATETLKHGPFFFYIKSSRPFDGCVTFRRTMAGGDSHPAKRQRRSVRLIESSSRCHRANAAAARGDLDELKSIAARRELRPRWDEGTFLEAAKNGRVDCLRFLHEQGCDTGTDASIFAAEAGHVECLKFLLEEKVGGFAPIPEDYRAGANYLSWMLDDYPIHSLTLVAAAEGGRVECLRLFNDNWEGWDRRRYWWDDATEALMYEAAARYGRLNVFQYMIVETGRSRRLDGPWVSALEGGGSRWRDIVMECAEYGHLAPDGEHMIHTTAYGLRKRPTAQKYWECVKFLFLARLNFVVDRGHGNASHGQNQLGYTHRDEIRNTAQDIIDNWWRPTAIETAIGLESWSPPFSSFLIVIACDHAASLVDLLERGDGTECEWRRERAEHVQSCDTLYHKYANFAYVDSRKDYRVTKRDAGGSVLGFMSRDYCEGLRLHHLAILGHVECMRVMRERGCPWSPLGVDWEAAIQFENLDVVKFLYEEGCNAREGVICAYKSAYLNYLSESSGYLPEHVVLEETVVSLAASVGYLPTLQYLCELIASNYSQLVFAAALNGRVEALRYLLNDLSDDDVKGGDNDQLCLALVDQKRERFSDARADYLGCLKLLREKGYKWDVDALLKSTDGTDGLMDIERYVKEGLPNPIARLWRVVEDLEGKIAEDAFRRLDDLFDFYRVPGRVWYDDDERDLYVKSMLDLDFNGVEHFFITEWADRHGLPACVFRMHDGIPNHVLQKEHRDEARRWWNTKLKGIMQVVDESVCGQVADNVYKQLCDELKAVHDIVN